MYYRDEPQRLKSSFLQPVCSVVSSSPPDLSPAPTAARTWLTSTPQQSHWCRGTKIKAANDHLQGQGLAVPGRHFNYMQLLLAMYNHSNPSATGQLSTGVWPDSQNHGEPKTAFARDAKTVTVTDAKWNSPGWIHDINPQNEKLTLIQYQSHQWCREISPWTGF